MPLEYCVYQATSDDVHGMMGCYLPLSEQRSNDIRDGLRDEVNAMSKKGTGRVTRVYCAFEKTTDTVVGFAKWLPGSYSGGSYYYELRFHIYGVMPLFDEYKPVAAALLEEGLKFDEIKPCKIVVRKVDELEPVLDKHGFVIGGGGFKDRATGRTIFQMDREPKKQDA